MFIPPKSDVCIKELFRNETVLRYFVSAVLAVPPESICTIRMKNTFLWRSHRKQKQGILDVLEIHILELHKKLEEDGEMEEWIRFFRAESEEDLNMQETKNPGILEAIREVRTMSLSRRMRLRYEAHMKQVRDERAWKTYEREEARKALQKVVRKVLQKVLQKVVRKALQRVVQKAVQKLSAGSSAI